MNLRDFVETAWPILEPHVSLRWHETFTEGVRLLQHAVDEDCNRVVLPMAADRLGKSLLFSVFYPAWLWGPLGKHQEDMLTVGYGTCSDIGMRDLDRFARLLGSPWYREQWPLTAPNRGVCTRQFYQNTMGGRRITLPTGGAVMGRRFDHVILDDVSLTPVPVRCMREWVDYSVRCALRPEGKLICVDSVPMEHCVVQLEPVSNA